MSLQDLPIARKLAVGFACVVTTVLVMSAALMLSLTDIRGATTANQTSLAKLAAADAALSALVEQQNAVRGYVGSGDESFPSRVHGFGDDFETAFHSLQGLTTDAGQLSTLDALHVEIVKVEAEEDAQIARRRDPAQRDAALASIPTSGRLTKARALLKSITDPEHALVTQRTIAQIAAFDGANLTLLGGGGIATLLSIAMGWMLTRAIAAPVRNMTDAMNQLAGGELGIDVPAVGRKDEVGLMAGAVQTFKDAAIEKVQLERAAEAQRREVEAERARAEEERARLAQEQAVVVTDLAGGLESLSRGVLTVRLQRPFAPTYEKLRADFNAAMAQLQEAIGVVASNASGIRSSAAEISQASEDLSRRTEQQAANLEETAAALDEITTTVQRTASGAKTARDAVAVAREGADRSSVVVRDAVSAMSEIERSAQQITQIIGVIDEIAFQTNLLALNAGVEAARAGEAGKGFAVVASEVRALAQRSAEAAKEIKALIQASSRQVDHGVSLVGETGKLLERIAAQVTEISGVVGDIAASAQEQAAGLAQVNTAVNQMDQVTQQNAAMVEQATAAAHSLADEAQQMDRQVSRFEVGEGERQAA